MPKKIYASPSAGGRCDGSKAKPFSDLQAAFDTLSDGDELILGGGEYLISSTLRLTGLHGVTVRAADGEAPVITSAKPLSMTEGSHNGIRAWKCTLPEVKKGTVYRTLLVNGVTRERPRMPAEGFYELKHVPNIDFEKAKTDESFKNELFKRTDRFFVNIEEITSLSRLEDVELVMPHYWAEEHIRIKSMDPVTGELTSVLPSRYSLADDFVERYSRYAIENCYEALDKGKWYVKTDSGELIYCPKDGETLTNCKVCIATLKSAAIIDRCEELSFSGVTFAGFDFWLPGETESDSTNSAYGQAASGAPSVLRFKYVKNSRIEGCALRDCGGYGIYIGNGCRNVCVNNCEIFDMGAGGVRINGADFDEETACASEPHKLTMGIEVTGCKIHDCGRVFYSACGIFSQHASYCRFAENEIHDMFYTGISVGWRWGYKPSPTHHMLIENNKIYNIGKRLLSDMGGIYTLGEQPGTIIRGNIIHDIRGRNYGGWGIYPDEGSSHIVIENNICYNTSSQGFHQHYGRENTVRNNIFAFCDAGEAAFSKPEEHNSVNFYNNIFLSDGRPFVICRSNRLREMQIHSDCNIFWNYGEAAPFAANGDNDGEVVFNIKEGFSFEDWNALGHDVHSEIKDPGFTDPKNGDFSIKSK